MSHVPSPAARLRRPRRLRRLAVGVGAVIGAGLLPAAAVSARAPAASYTSGGWTTNAASSPTTVPQGTTVTLTVTVSSSWSRSGLVDLEVYTPSARVFQQFWDGQSFTAGQARTFTARWTAPSGAVTGQYRVAVGVFAPGWTSLQHWNNTAGSFSVATATTTTTAPATTAPATTAPTTTTTAPATTTTTTAPTTTAPTTSARFTTLPPGSPLPSDATCASRVRPAAEVRADNAGYNATRGQTTAAVPNDLFTRVTGNYTGTTDQIIQWAACKWGFDEDIIRAQVAKESWWHQNTLGDWSSDPARCAPGHGIGVDGRSGQCPESVGLLQVRYPYWQSGFPASVNSSAYNMDYALAARRSCFEGRETWLGGSYGPGDLWGCVGLWFSGRWYDAGARDYIAAVQSYYNQRIWETSSFKNG